MPDEEYKRVDRLVRAGAARSVAELVRLAVRGYVSKAGANKVLNLRDVSISKAKGAVERYLKEHYGTVWPDEMAEDLGIDYRVVLTVLSQLLREKKVEYAATKIEAVQT